MTNIDATDIIYGGAEAERAKFFPIDRNYLTTLGYPTDAKDKYAVATYSINDPTSGASGAILDGVDNAIAATVVDLSGSNPLATMIVDANGDQITTYPVSIVDNTITTTALSGIQANTIGSSIDVADYTTLTFHVLADVITTGADVLIQSSLDGSNWVTLNSDTKTYTNTENTEDVYSDIRYKYVRGVVENYVDGTYTVLLYGGN